MIFGRKKIGVALSGGGARGLAHIGVLQVLEETGVEISAISGCSMGAIVGALYCSGISLEEIENYSTSVDWGIFLMFNVFSLSRSGVINNKKVNDVLKKFLGDKTFEDCPKKFCCVSADLLSGKKVVLTSGNLREAVTASLAVPGVFSPVCHQDLLLVDGGIIEPLPTESLKLLNIDFTIASSIIFKGTGSLREGTTECDLKIPESKKLSIQTILDRSLSIMHAQIIKGYMANAQITIEPMVGDFGFFDFKHSKAIIAAGRQAATEKIPEIRKKLKLK